MPALHWTPASGSDHFLAPPTAAALNRLAFRDRIEATEIDPDISDTAALVEASDVLLSECANCVVVAGKRSGQQRVAALLVLATTRADVNNVVRKHLDVRKLSFMSTGDAVERTGMEYGGITPIGLPDDWPILIDPRVTATSSIIIGSGVRRGKLRLPGSLAADLPGAQLVDGLAREIVEV